LIGKMKKEKPLGTCRLTGKHGAFVASHIIPRAVTRLSMTGEKHLEAEIGQRVRKRSDSWYDRELVTRIGEDILSEIDSKAIKQLRGHRLIWSGWGSDNELRSDEVISGTGGPSYRSLLIENTNVLRVFFLSLLWRAAASSRPEFADIKLNEDDLEDLRQRVLYQNPGQLEDYPIQLFQLVNRGPAHNRTPILEYKTVINASGAEQEVPYIRFYFDGLVAHLLLCRHVPLIQGYLNTCLGFQDETIVFAYKAEESRTYSNLRELIRSTTTQAVSKPTLPFNSIAAAIRTVCVEK
jgi:hypothetical protein